MVIELKHVSGICFFFLVPVPLAEKYHFYSHIVLVP